MCAGEKGYLFRTDGHCFLLVSTAHAGYYDRMKRSSIFICLARKEAGDGKKENEMRPCRTYLLLL